MPNLDDLHRFLADETGLATISTVQQDGRVLSSIANCGIIRHPLSGIECVALVSVGTAARLRHVRRGSEVTIAVRRGWNWVAATGKAELIGPDDNVDWSTQKHCAFCYVRFIRQPVEHTTISTNTTPK